MRQGLLYDGGGKFVLDVHRLHQADATWAVDKGIFLAKGCQFAAPVCAHVSGMLYQVFIADGFERCQGGSASDRIAAKGSAVIARGKCVAAWPGQHGSNGDATR